jgi:hypothetical protein
MAITVSLSTGSLSTGSLSTVGMIRGAVWGALTMVVMACGGAQHPPAEQSAATTESISELPAGEAPTCVDEKDQRVSCLSDADCCAGFVCGKDPELSHRMSYCIYGG